jgi:Tfp pilus assembly protein PilF
MPALRHTCLVTAAICFAATAPAAFDLRGRFEDVTAPLQVRISGAETPFSATTTSDTHGRFHFRALNPGTYIISAHVRGHGEATRTVVITPTLADAKHTVTIAIPLPPPVDPSDRARHRSMVSVAQLSVSDAARQKYDQAQKDLAHTNVESATIHLKQAVVLAPKFSAAWNSLGVISYQTRDFPSAESYFRKALESDPGAWTPTVNLGGVLLNLNKPSEALAYNQSAVQMHPNDALANSQLGLNYFQIGQPDRAERYLRTAEQIDPSHFSHPQLTLAEIYARRGDQAATLRELNDFVQRFPDSPAAADIRKRLERFNK